jgi:ribosome biogenesis SPOUT family RNA methylase Rps3
MAPTQRPEYIVEHMEDLDSDPTSPTTFPHWALLEYYHMLTLVGPGSTVHFTGLVSEASKEALHNALSSDVSSPKNAVPVADFKVHPEGILEMAKKNGISINEICLLDPKSPFPLSVSDATPSVQHSERPGGGPFRYFLLGGILGDDPPRDRTGHLRAMGFPGRHLGTVQMTTDGALGVTKVVVEDGKALNLPGTESTGANGAIEWIDHPEIHFGRGESVSHS